MPTRRIAWSRIDRLLSGCHRPAGGGERPFEVPVPPDADFGFARVRPGPAWPAALPPVRRVVALPLPRQPLEAAPEQAVLLCEDAPGGEGALIAVAESGVRFAVDPGAWIQGLLTEGYVRGWRRPLPSRLPLVNYARVPHAVKGWLEPLQSPRAARAARLQDFPELPFDDLVERLRGLFARLAWGQVERPTPWPDGCRAAVTLSHDLDTPWILAGARRGRLGELLAAERGFRGAWYVTASRLRQDRHGAALERIAAEGHEIGCHGWSHDAKLAYLGARRQQRRLARAAARLGPGRRAGIRTPWNSRSPALLEVAARHFEYDASVPTASGFYSAESNSGCCSVFPFRHPCGLLEIPATLPPDTGLAASERYAVMAGVADRVVELGGVVHATLHPQPHQSGSREGIAAWSDFLSELDRRHGDRLWRATPAEIARRYTAFAAS